MGCFVFSAKDMGAANVIVPLALRARSNGHEVHVVTEGLAASRFEKVDFALDFKGSVDFTKQPFDFDARHFLNSLHSAYHTKLLVIGESSPPNLEAKLGAVAAGIIPWSIVECQDFWRGHRRFSGFMPDLVLTLDEFARDLAIGDLDLSPEQVVVVGNPGAKQIFASQETKDVFGDLRSRYDRVFFYAGGGGYTSDELKLLVACLEKTPGRNALVVSFHPKRVLEFGAEWRAFLAGLGENVMEAKQGTGEEWSSLTTTISGFSTLLTTAVFHGHTAISLKTPATMASLERQSGLTEVPHVALGCAHPVTEETDLSILGFLSEGAAKIKPYDSALAWKAVQDFMRR